MALRPVLNNRVDLVWDAIRFHQTLLELAAWNHFQPRRPRTDDFQSMNATLMPFDSSPVRHTRRGVVVMWAIERRK
jgi:hypothetical protein